MFRAGWKEIPFRGGGPQDGGASKVRGVGRVQFLRFVDPANDPAAGVKAGDLLHVYEYVKAEDGSESYAYRGTETKGT